MISTGNNTGFSCKAKRPFQVGDRVIVVDTSFLNYLKVCPPKERPCKEGIVLRIERYGEILVIQHRMGAYKIDKRSHVSTVFPEMVRLSSQKRLYPNLYLHSLGTVKTNKLKEYCMANERICPLPMRWGELYGILKNKTTEKPFRPLLISLRSKNVLISKQLVLFEHIDWAKKQNQIEEISTFLYSLPESEWLHRGD